MPTQVSRTAQVRALKQSILVLKVSAKVSGQKPSSEMVRQMKQQIEFLKISDLFSLLDDKWGRDGGGFTDPVPFESFRNEVIRLGRKTDALQRSFG